MAGHSSDVEGDLDGGPVRNHVHRRQHQHQHHSDEPGKVPTVVTHRLVGLLRSAEALSDLVSGVGEMQLVHLAPLEVGCVLGELAESLRQRAVVRRLDGALGRMTPRPPRRLRPA